MARHAPVHSERQSCRIDIVILVTHAVGGAAASLLFKNHPVAAFAAGFVSHFILDAIPHWHYQIKSFAKDEHDPIAHKTILFRDPRFAMDIIRTGIDFGAGLLITLVAVMHSPHDAHIASLMAGAVGGVLPDFLQVLYYALPNSPLKYLQRFHMWIHAKRRFDNEPLIGISSQLAILVVLALLVAHF
jgi:hypothetical protein